MTDIIAAALAKDPDFGNLPPNIHPDIRKLSVAASKKIQRNDSELLEMYASKSNSFWPIPRVY